MQAMYTMVPLNIYGKLYFQAMTEKKTVAFILNTLFPDCADKQNLSVYTVQSISCRCWKSTIQFAWHILFTGGAKILKYWTIAFSWYTRFTGGAKILK